MAKLSEAQAKILRHYRENGGAMAPAGTGRTVDALLRRYALAETERGYRLTPTGRTLLDEHERAEQAKQEQADRASRPVPASAFVEPSARTAPVLGLEYDEEPDEDEIRADADFSHTATGDGQSVRLTPAPAGVEQEATDAEILQLLTLMDAGMKVTRGLYQTFRYDGGPEVFGLDLDRVDRAARDAVRFGLATQAFSERLYRLSAEPIHLLNPDWSSPCGLFIRRPATRLRYTTDPAKVTHERCK